MRIVCDKNAQNQEYSLRNAQLNGKGGKHFKKKK